MTQDREFVHCTLSAFVVIQTRLFGWSACWTAGCAKLAIKEVLADTAERWQAQRAGSGVPRLPCFIRALPGAHNWAATWCILLTFLPGQANDVYAPACAAGGQSPAPGNTVPHDTVQTDGGRVAVA